MALLHSSFYRFTPMPDPPGSAEWLRERGAALALGGVVLVAQEGLSAAIAGEADAVRTFEAELRAQPGLAGLHFKHNICERRPFSRLKVSVKREIVAFGVPGVSGEDTGTHVSPQRFRELLAHPDTVVLDNRNSFEFKLGRFRGAVDPGVAHFRDFPAYVEAHLEVWQGKTVAMYCTGGIRCEKTAAWMQQRGLNVAQLDGGILGFLEAFPDDAATDWQGECYVFDKRIAIDAMGRETGTTAEDVFTDPADVWRLARARRLDPEDGAA
ncbi:MULTISPECIES: rhodanese-like domain-containing protein [unclassified Roseateles]|uniref:oxygen-dependent tRNA uridine(34) hydroxylase TrhO n=1 Tax=unclassified Roseateles TaxID=2626991 RepID=UPI0009E7D06B|nr:MULTISPECIES: rhodanese-like domain-containing protein [unclassified Roseateles]